MEYYDYIEKIKQLILEFFNEQTIQEESYLHSSKIRSAIAEFTKEEFDWPDRTLFEDLKNEFSGFVFDNQTHFYCNDRCLQINVDKKDNNFNISYTIAVSIFNFFFINQQNFEKLSSGRYQYEDMKFIDRGTDRFTSRVFEIVKEYFPMIKWLPSEILLTPIKNLNVFSNKLRTDILIVDVLFTQHR